MHDFKTQNEMQTCASLKSVQWEASWSKRANGRTDGRTDGQTW
jgi:hypothetical protein